MANLWQFFGLPDPEAPAKEQRQRMKAASAEKPAEQEATTGIRQTILGARTAKPSKAAITTPATWDGPLNPDGEPFHDLADNIWQERTQRLAEYPFKALRYVMPDEMHRLPLAGMAKRLGEGDILIVDLRSLIHMDAHQSACRRMLRELANEQGVLPFALDEEEKLLLMPGRGVSVDLSRHELGISNPALLV